MCGARFSGAGVRVATLNVHDFDGLIQRLNSIPARTQLIFVRDVTGEAQFGDGLRHKMVVQLLGAVDLMPARHAAGVEMRDPLEIVADGPADVAFP